MRKPKLMPTPVLTAAPAWMSARKMPSQWKIKKHSNLFREKTEWRKSKRLFPPFLL
jgi:hypothetical protein